MRLSELETPVLTADLDAIERNVFRMQAYCDEHGVALRPHIKTHKLPELARLQLEGGAVGITCQKLGEAEVMADAGIDDILLSFPLVGDAKAERLAALAERVKMTVVGDSAAVARASRRCSPGTGSRSTSWSSATRGWGGPASRARRRPPSWPSSSTGSTGLRFAGLMTYPSLPETAAWLRAARDAVEARGLSVDRVSGGGTPTAERTHELGVVDELRVGHLHLRRPRLHRQRLGAARGLRAARRRDRRQPADARAGDHRRGLEDADVGPGDRRDRPRPARRVSRTRRSTRSTRSTATST